MEDWWAEDLILDDEICNLLLGIKCRVDTISLQEEGGGEISFRTF